MTELAPPKVDVGVARLFVTVGTDHHPFDRIIRWVDEWAAGRGSGQPVLLQSGTSRHPHDVPSVDFLPFDEMLQAMADADAVVTHGGPTTIAQIRKAGRVPIVVPRRSVLGEHVDDHQVRFARRLADLGDVVLAETQDAFVTAVDRILETPELGVTTVEDSQVRAATAEVARIADDLVHGAAR